MRDYIVGDAVRLKSGGPGMLVTECCYTPNNEQWACVVTRLNDSNELQTATLPEVCLAPVASWKVADTENPQYLV